MAASTFRLETPGEGVGVLWMEVPGEPVNTLRADFEAELEGLLRRAADDPAITSLVLASGKPDGFIAGADVQMLRAVKTAAEATALSRGGQASMNRLEEIGKRKPVVAAIHGPALGGGLELALACTYRICRRGPRRSSTTSGPRAGRRRARSPRASSTPTAAASAWAIPSAPPAPA